MKRTTPYLCILFLSFIGIASYGQCTVVATPAGALTLTCGRTMDITLNAYGSNGNYLTVNDFNNETIGTGWSATPSVGFTNPCVPSLDGTTHLWVGDATAQPRYVATPAYDLSAGGSVCFEMRFSEQGDDTPCEGPDEPLEGVYLQYSVDNGNTWVTIEYFDPVGGYDITITSWQEYCYILPQDAQTSSTTIRWYQDQVSSEEHDHWGLDNIYIEASDPGYSYLWQHNGYSGTEPPVVTVNSDTVFVVSYGNGVDDICYDTVAVQTVPPEFLVSSIADPTYICPEECIELTTEVDIIVRPFSQSEFTRTESVTIPPFGTTATVPLAVFDVDVATVDSSILESVCLDVNNLFVLQPSDLSGLSVSLECPSGASIDLIEVGDLSGTILTNTCFSNNGISLAAAASPYTGSYVPASGSFDDLIGCPTNGIWNLNVTITAGAFAFDQLDTFSIKFNVPELSYQGYHSWSPSQTLDNQSSLSPLACPQESTVYQLMVSDSFNCASYTHPVSVFIEEPTPYTDVITACNSFVWIDGMEYAENNDTSSFILAGAAENGCDSIIELDLTIINALDPTVNMVSDTLIAAQAGVDYQWLDCDNGSTPIPGATMSWFAPVVTGNYAVQLSTEGCSVTSTCNPILITKIEDQPTWQNVSIYPNPTTNFVTIDFRGVTTSGFIEVKNTLGQTMFTSSYENVGRLDLSIPGAAGLYLIVLTSQKGELMQYPIVKN